MRHKLKKLHVIQKGKHSLKYHVLALEYFIFISKMLFKKNVWSCCGSQRARATFFFERYLIIFRNISARLTISYETIVNIFTYIVSLRPNM